MKTKIYGTIGPSCSNASTLQEMFALGMTGLRLNTSHTTLRAAAEQIAEIHKAAKACGIKADLLIDLQGPELRVGQLAEPVTFTTGECLALSWEIIPFPKLARDALTTGQQFLLDDGKILLEVISADSETARTAPIARSHFRSSDGITVKVLRGGTLTSRKSIALPGSNLRPPTLTEQDLQNIRDAGYYGVTGLMQPFVRDAEDLKTVREALHQAGLDHIRIFAKIENLEGVQNLQSFFLYCDEIVIARGDLGNAMPLWKLPVAQAMIEGACKRAGKPFMVVTQMLASMEHAAVPTRAEVSDIFRAVSDGAASVMVTGETAVGDYPVEVIRYLANTAWEAEAWQMGEFARDYEKTSEE